MRVALVLLFAAMAGLAVAAWWVRPLSVARGLARLDSDEGECLLAILRAAVIAPAHVRLVEISGEPCSTHRPHAVARWVRLDRSTRYACVGVRQGRVESLRLTGAALRELASLAELASLRHVELRDGDLERVGRLPKGCGWETLDVSQNRLRQLDGLEACTALTALDVARNRLRELPFATFVDLETLDASGNPILDLSPLKGLDRLTDLVLRDLPISDPNSIPPLPALERLELARTDIERVDAEALARWPRLRWLELSETPLREVACAYEVDNALDYPTLRLESGLRIGVNETLLGRWRQVEAVAAHDGTATQYVDALPRGSGRWQGTRRRERTQSGIGSRVDASGSAEWMTGAHAIQFDIDRGLFVTVTASVERGRLRMYLRDGEGYTFAEAIPGRALSIQGPLITGTDSYVVFAEAIGGRVEGILWSVRSTS